MSANPKITPRVPRPKTRWKSGLSGILLALGSVAVGCLGAPVDTLEDAPSEEELIGAVEEELTTTGPTLTLQPGAEGKDARVFSLPSGVDTNYANIPRIDAMAWTWDGVPGTIRNFFDFDLAQLPTGSVVRRATLVLTGDAVPGGQPSGHSTLSGPNDWKIEPVTQPWAEDTITWNNQPATDPSRAVLLPASTAADESYEVDVTSLIQDELKTPSARHGFLLRLQNEQHYRAVQFASSDHPVAAKRPRLVLEYTSSARVGSADCAVDFTGSHSGLNGKFDAYLMSGVTPADFTWDFGDGSTDVGNFAHHTFAAPGTYLVCVTMNATSPKDGSDCTAKKCSPIPVMSVTGSCCDPNDKLVDKDIEYAPGHFAKFEFRSRNVGIIDQHSLIAEVTTYSGTKNNKKREKVDHLYADIIGKVRALDSGKECGTTATPVDNYDNNFGESHLKVKIPVGQSFGLGAGEATAYFTVTLGSISYTYEMSLAECKTDGQSCSRDSACGSGSCGGCLGAELGWCFTPNSTPYGGDCKADDQCQSGRCSADCYFNPNGKCLCDDAADCGAGQYCGWGFNSGKCQDKKGNGASCAGHKECQSGSCGGIIKGLGHCFAPKSKTIGQGCRADGECTTNRCVDTRLVCGCTNDSQCGGEFCNHISGDCRPKRGKNAVCSRDNHCKSGKCRTIGLCK